MKGTDGGSAGPIPSVSLAPQSLGKVNESSVIEAMSRLGRMILAQ